MNNPVLFALPDILYYSKDFLVKTKKNFVFAVCTW